MHHYFNMKTFSAGHFWTTSWQHTYPPAKYSLYHVYNIQTCKISVFCLGYITFEIIFVCQNNLKVILMRNLACVWSHIFLKRISFFSLPINMMPSDMWNIPKLLYRFTWVQAGWNILNVLEQNTALVLFLLAIAPLCASQRQEQIVCTLPLSFVFKKLYAVSLLLMLYIC